MSNNEKPLPQKMARGKDKDKREIRLKDIVDTRRYLSGLINRVERDEVDAQKAAKLVFACNTLIKAQELESIEKRLLRLKAAAEARQVLDVTPRALLEGKP